jgi:putative endonuclease
MENVCVIQKMEKHYFVYIMASKFNGTLYIGVTNDLVRRVLEHKNDVNPGFTQKYGVHTLVYFEETGNIEGAILREKQLKRWNRAWKLGLIDGTNPEWKDLWNEIYI